MPIELHPFSKAPETFIASRLGKVIFTSREKGLKPIVDFIHQSADAQELVLFDNVVGKAAAMLFTLIRPRAVYGLVGSDEAVEVLQHAGINFHFVETVQKLCKCENKELPDYEKMCHGKTPEEFLHELTATLTDGKITKVTEIEAKPVRKKVEKGK